MSSTTPIKVRLQAKKMLLEKEASRSAMRLKNNVAYAKGSPLQVLGSQVHESVQVKNPTIAKLFDRVTGRSKRSAEMDTERIQNGGAEYSLPVKGSKGLSDKLIALGSLLLPFVINVGRKKALGLGLKGGRKALGSTFSLLGRMLFGKKRR